MSKAKLEPIIGHVTKGSVFLDPALFEPARGAELHMRAELLRGLERWLKTAGTQAAAAKVLGVTQARVSDIKRGKINTFSLDLLVRLAARAGLKPTLRLAA
ncbi:MAG: XRE family transcriptional regulator [Rudaea sp.]|uniref:helix-turn-helix domain-containing protein n=1 Tax=Rudaea sp. TaxID=2136325 RepID=UPI0039E5147C